MEYASVVLATCLLGLSLVLALVAAIASRRLADPRLGGVAGSLGAFAVVGALALLNQFSPRYGPGLYVAPIPLGVLVVAVALLYLSFVRGRPSARVTG